MLSRVQAQARDGYLAKCKDGTVVTVELKRQDPSRTRQQLRGFWGHIIAVAKQALDDAGIDTMGVPLSQEQVKEVLYAFCAQVGENGQIVSLSKQSKMQTVCFFENVAAWLATNFGVTNTLDFDPMWREHIGAQPQGQEQHP